MKVTKFYCDCCRKEIIKNPNTLAYEDLDGLHPIVPSRDICNDCIKEVIQFIDGRKNSRNDLDKFSSVTSTAFEEEPNAKGTTDDPEELPKKSPKKKQEIDVGKLFALKAAGWSVAKIADELGCSQAAIYNHINER